MGLLKHRQLACFTHSWVVLVWIGITCWPSMCYQKVLSFPTFIAPIEIEYSKLGSYFRSVYYKWAVLCVQFEKLICPPLFFWYLACHLKIHVLPVFLAKLTCLLFERDSWLGSMQDSSLSFRFVNMAYIFSAANCPLRMCPGNISCGV